MGSITFGEQKVGEQADDRVFETGQAQSDPRFVQ
jgi:hypothetical protein